jgi:hypothetical protein
LDWAAYRAADEQLMNSWWTADEQLMNSWWTADELLMNSWWTGDEQLVKTWWTADEQLMNSWWTADEQLMNSCPAVTEWISEWGHGGRQGRGRASRQEKLSGMYKTITRFSKLFTIFS